MKSKELYSQYIREHNIDGSNKASSYIKALDLLTTILRASSSIHHDSNFWLINSIDTITDLYKYALEFQKKEGSEFLKSDLPPSYGRKGYYSAALKSYKEFLIIHHHKENLWEIVNNYDETPTDLSKRLQKRKIKNIDKLVADQGYYSTTKEGKEILRLTKTRINQNFFRDLLLKTYHSQCCVTGLNIPSVLRASHIVPWSQDKDNRLNPENGLCLSATYDAAFDRHLISFDEDYRMIFSNDLKEYYTNKAFQTQFRAFEGKQISIPKVYMPSQYFLEKHRNKTVL